MSRLNPHESRVLGVLIEKAQTTPSQYPITLNALVTGCNQKNNRLPVLSLVEDQVMRAIDGLRVKGLVREVLMSGSRVQKYRHVARETIEVSTSELVVLAELLLRGPQTVGEIRGRATRMHPLESIEIVSNLLEHLMAREEPLIQRVAPAPGSRAERFAQLLCPALHPIDAAAPASASARSSSATPPTEANAAPAPTSAPVSSHPDLEARVARLEAEVAKLREVVAALQGPS